jgi:hypothetical protein
LCFPCKSPSLNPFQASFPGRFAFLDLLPDPVAGISDITKQCAARYGMPPVNTRVFIHTLQLISGWEDDFKDTSAAVPRG